jgi:hypothetical protein
MALSRILEVWSSRNDCEAQENGEPHSNRALSRRFQNFGLEKNRDHSSSLFITDVNGKRVIFCIVRILLHILFK